MVLFNVGFATSLLSQWASIFNGLVDVPSSESTLAACTTTAGDLAALVTCHVTLVQRHIDNLDIIQPTPTERSQWSDTVQALLNVDGNCLTIAAGLPLPLKDTYTVREIGGFCALVEFTTDTGGVGGRVQYKKGWGMFVTPAQQSLVKRNLHFSAPHPIFDSLTAEQAGNVFGGTGARSLYIAGRKRDAFLEHSDCIAGSGDTTYWKTDPAHDNIEMMFETYKKILEWQNAHGGCNSASCAYVQFHGKGTDTCPAEQIFLSSGIGRSSSSLLWYTDPAHATLPIHRLAAQISADFPSFHTTIPSSPGSTCSLTATDNIMGRLINGIPADRVCFDAATASTTTGQFVHIEQVIDARESGALATWVSIFEDSFAVLP